MGDMLVDISRAVVSCITSHAHTYIHTYIHAYIHTYIHGQVLGSMGDMLLDISRAVVSCITWDHVPAAAEAAVCFCMQVRSCMYSVYTYVCMCAHVFMYICI